MYDGAARFVLACSINVHDAQKTMEVCLAADLSAARGGQPVTLPLIGGRP